MKTVKIYKLQNDGSQKEIMVCKLIDNEVVCEGDKIFVENLKKSGIKDYSDQGGDTMLKPEDGLKFLQNLKFAFRSDYLNATDIIEK